MDDVERAAVETRMYAIAMRANAAAEELVNRYRRHKDDENPFWKNKCEGYLEAISLLAGNPVAEVRRLLSLSDDEVIAEAESKIEKMRRLSKAPLN